MAKREDPWARLAKPQAPRVVGVHKGCGGTVLYTSTATRGWRHCQTCGDRKSVV